MTIEKEPVCGMGVDTSATDLKLEHGGKTHRFCGRGRLLAFRDDPERFLGRAISRRCDGPVSAR